MTKEIECPWCGEKVIPEKRILQRKSGEIIESSCPSCGKVIAAYLSGEPFLGLIRKRVVSFED